MSRKSSSSGMGRREEKEEIKVEKCRDCNKVVSDTDAGILCELCESWFHATCQKISEDVYAFLKKYALVLRDM